VKNILFKLFGLVLLVASALAGWFSLELHTYKDKALNVSQPVSVIIAPGSHLGAIARGLADRGVTDKPQYFVLWGRWFNYATRIQAGEYELRPGMTPIEFMQDLVSGNVIQHDLTLIEGWSFKQVLDVIWKHPKINPTLKGLSDEEIMKRLGKAGEHPEGRFFPTTYHFPSATTDLAFLRRAYDAMQTVLDTEWETRDPNIPLQSAYEALILASIVEKETGAAHERPEIAGVFTRRLNKNMRLQTDPTVIYGMGDLYDGDIRWRDLRRDTAYNTYTRKGLPPTPIAMPSQAAIHAALHPLAGTSLYFVSRGDGTHYFSATLREHEKAVDKYQRKRNR